MNLAGINNYEYLVLVSRKFVGNQFDMAIYNVI